MEFLFWPLMIASIILAIIGIARKKAMYLVFAAFSILPFSFYLAATPLFKGWGLVLPFCYLGAAFMLKKQVHWLASMLVLPVFGVITWIGYLVVTQV